MDYEDFVLELGTDARGPTVRVAHSPAGESDPETLSLLWGEGEIVKLVAAFAMSAEAKRQGRDLDTPEIAETSIAETGDTLFRALFPEAVRSLYLQSLGRVAVREQGLRIRIEVGLNTTGAAQLHSIPWEYLANDGQFLCLSREISIVRYLALGLPGDRPPVPAPLSILVLPGEQLSAGELDLAEEQRELERAWSESGNVRIHVLRECTLEALREELLTRDYHALHFMGHGAFSAATGEGALAFNTKQGQRIWVSGTELAEQLRDRSSLRLVFLNACRTAQAGAMAPYSGVAPALLRVGIPAVIAMQFPISDCAALALSRAFYRRIARGDTVDAAVTEGRMAIRRLAPDNTEWGTPVLFERLTTGRIVKPESALPLPSGRSRRDTAVPGRRGEHFSPFKNPRSRRTWLNWGAILSLLGVLLTLGAWLWPRSFSLAPPPPQGPALYSIRVQVLDPQGHPVSGSTVRSSTSNEPHLLPDGWWQIEIPAAKIPANGQISIWAEHESWEGNRVYLRLGDDPNLQAEIRLRPPETWVRGRVVDGLNRAIPGVRVAPEDGTPGVAITDADGRFELKLSVPQETRVRFRAEYADRAPGDVFCYAGRDTCSIVLEGK
ncbi:MAG: CHAT domain-containing protein [Acidobacteria bacterium]|nr:CHAT domain-containing protein [Acidobacteriota bacterium]